MPVCGKFELNVTVNTQEELDKIAEAIYNGFAENIIKERVLWPQYDTPVVTPVTHSEPGPALERTATKTKVSATTPAPVKKERATGIIGRGRMGRT